MVSTPDRAAGARLASRLGLEPLPHEGGLSRRTYADARLSVIYFLLLAPEFSAMHALASTEAYHWYAGWPLQLLLLPADGTVAEPVLGPDLEHGQLPQLVVPPGTWQGSAPLGPWSLIGATTAPPFDWSAFTLGDRRELVRQYPHARRRIESLTRQPPS